MIIDAHAYVFPDPYSLLSKTRALRRRARDWVAPFSHAFHRSQEWMRVVPEPIRNRLDPWGALAALPGLAIECTLEDYLEILDEQRIGAAVIAAHPPYSPNEFVLDAARKDSRLLPAVNIPADAARPSQLLRKYHDQGARLLKLNPAADGLPPESPRYAALLKTSADLGLPVILHTGRIHSPFFRDPELGRAELFREWFKSHPEVKFILAHMNYHEPAMAIDLAEEFPNVWLETSWQPMEMISEAVRRVGPEKVLFGTDWPFIGDNVSIGLGRIRDCINAGTLTSPDADLILGLNAAKLLGVPCP